MISPPEMGGLADRCLHRRSEESERYSAIYDDGSSLRKALNIAFNAV